MRDSETNFNKSFEEPDVFDEGRGRDVSREL